MNQLIHNSSPTIPNSEFRIPNLKRAFTLIELLIVIAIIGVLTAMSLTLLAGASNDAKISATQARISQITNILQLQMEDYEVRRFPISNRILMSYIEDTGGNPVNQIGTLPARLQLKYLRRQLLMALIDSELPRPMGQFPSGQPVDYFENEFAGQLGSGFDLDEPSNFANGGSKHSGVFGMPSNTLAGWLNANYGNAITLRGASVTLAGLLNRVAPSGARKFQRQVDVGVDVDANGVPIELNLPGEYLHEILRSIQIDGQSAVESLGNAAIGDTDDDGIPEVIDAGGEPFLFDIEQFSATVDGDGSVRSNDNGVVPLDPRYPMALGDIQIVVGSNRIPESLPVVERISRGVE